MPRKMSKAAMSGIASCKSPPVAWYGRGVGALFDRQSLEPDRDAMLRLLERVRLECGASTGKRRWSALVGLAGGRVAEVESVDLDVLPVVVLGEEKHSARVHTTLRDIVYVELRGTEAPLVRSSLEALAVRDPLESGDLA